MKASDGIEAFTVTAVERLGGAAEERAPGLYTVLWPADPAGQVETRQLAFDPEALEEEPAAELVTFASESLEQIVGLATASGRVARAFLNATSSASRAVAERLARSYRFAGASWTAGPARPWWLPAAIFLFRARLLSDAREEELFEVSVSLADRRIFRRLAEAIERHGLAAEPNEAWPMMAELPVADIFAVARDELERKLLAPLGARRRELESRLARESGRAAAYYDELAREIEEQRSLLPAGAPERARLESRLAAVRLERAGRLAELRRKYALEVDVSLLSVLRLYLPRLVFHGTLADKHDTRELTLVWDPLEHAGEPLRCQRCGGFTYEAVLDRRAVVCPSCVDKTALRRPASGEGVDRRRGSSG